VFGGEAQAVRCGVDLIGERAGASC